MVMQQSKAKAPLRIAALIRVSTEKQEQQGESLQVQKRQITEAVQSLGGKLQGLYGGQEHATQGWERAELDRLLSDATKHRFDGVMVAHADRWSRDNLKSQQGLQILVARRDTPTLDQPTSVEIARNVMNQSICLPSPAVRIDLFYQPDWGYSPLNSRMRGVFWGYGVFSRNPVSGSGRSISCVD